MRFTSALFALLLSFSFASANAAEKTGLTLEDLTRVSYIASASVSPNGKHIAYIKTKPREIYKDKDGTAWTELYVTDTKGNSRPFITGKVSVGRVSWSDDSSTIYFTAKRGEDKHASLYALPVDGGEATQLFSHKTAIGSYDISADDSKLVFIAKAEEPKHVKKLNELGFNAKVYEEGLKYSDVFVVDLNADEPKAEKLDVEGYVQSITFNPKGNGFLAKISPTPLIDDIYMLSKISVLDNNGSVIAKLNADGKVGKALWSPNGKSIAFINAEDTHDPKEGILTYRAAADGSNKLLQPGLLGHTMDIAFLPKGDILALNHINTESEVAIISPKGKKKVLKTGDRVVRSLSTPKDARGFAFIADTSTHPRELFWYQGGKVKRLTNSNPWLADRQLARQESITWKAGDGLEIQGVLVYPLNYEKGKRYPLINFVHGGPEAHVSNGWVNRYSEPAHVAAAQGYFSLYPNYRGSTGRGVEYSKAGQHSYATPEFDDIVDGKNHLVELGMVDKDKVGITGGSYGGFATAWSSTALSEHYAAGVMFVGISNQLSKFGTTDIPNEMYKVHARAWPWEDFQWMLERSPIFHAKKHRTPLLIMHGEKDTRVHPSQSMEMYRYLKTLNNSPVRLVLYPNEPHGNKRAGGQYDYSLRFMRWMDHYLKGEGGEPPAYDLQHETKLSKD